MSGNWRNCWSLLVASESHMELRPDWEEEWRRRSLGGEGVPSWTRPSRGRAPNSSTRSPLKFETSLDAESQSSSPNWMSIWERYTTNRICPAWPPEALMNKGWRPTRWFTRKGRSRVIVKMEDSLNWQREKGPQDNVNLQVMFPDWDSYHPTQKNVISRSKNNNSL